MENRKSYDFLVIDDEVFICQLMERWINEAGYSCKTTTSGPDALELFEKYNFSVVVTDIMMPEVSGIDILKHVRNRYKDTPVIMITALEDHESIKEAYNLGAYGYMNKPLNQNAVLSNILNALRRRELETENRAYSKSLEDIIDARTKEIEGALENISNLMGKIINDGDFNVRFENSQLVECYNEMNCQKHECPCYGIGPKRCWQISGTYCGNRPQGKFTEKYGKCSECPVYIKATSKYGLELGEHFNNMMNMLALKHQDLSNSYEDLKKSQQQVIQQEKMATIGQLSAGIAHEINNPVGFVSSNINSLQKYFNKLTDFIALQSDVITVHDQGGTPININAEKKRLKINFVLDDMEDLFKESIDGCERIQSIVRDLKGFARSDDDNQELVDINELINKTINVVWNQIKYTAQVEKNYSNDLPKVNCFPHKLSQVIMNLIVNASHAIEEQGTITIKSWQEDKSVFVSIKDSGCGIPAENLSDIFEAFFTTKEEGKGTGLGLSICKDIVSKHNGEISVDSTVGEGTTFTVSIPAE